MSSTIRLANQWHSDFNKFAGDLYPGRYTLAYCHKLAEQKYRLERLLREKDADLLVHYYQYPEFHEISDGIGDSLALARLKTDAKIIYFIAVAFMAQTYKILNPEKRVFIIKGTRELGCSLVFGTDHAWIENWRKLNPTGIVISYINSDPYTKALSHYISTSRNTDKIIIDAVKNNPGSKVLFLPDKYLGMVMKARALYSLRREGIIIDPNLIEIYQHEHNGYHASCYIHEEFKSNAVEIAMMQNPDAELLIHPESDCGCTSLCKYESEEGSIEALSFFSTEQMLHKARESSSNKFIIATEPGMLYALRKSLPNKTFIPVLTPSLTETGELKGHCKYMKGNTFDELEKAITESRIEIVICPKGCLKCLNPRVPYEDSKVIHIPRHIADLARSGIQKMLPIIA